MADGTAVEAVRSQAAEVARGWSPPGAPPSWALTASIFDTLASDDDLLAIAAEIPSDRMPALLFCAATCYLVAEHEPPGFVDYFPGATPQRAVDDRFPAAMRAFGLRMRDQLADISERRRYQMNEVARTTQVAIALGAVRRPDSEGIALVDVGTGAGLGLWPDRYGHRLSTGERYGDQASTLRLECEAAGPALGSQGTPPIVHRIGIDLDPIDVRDEDDRRWARACLPPDADALRRFDEAVPLADPRAATVLRADAVEALPDVLDAVPDSVTPVVVDTYTAVFFDDGQRRRFDEILDRFGTDRDVAWVSLDPLIPLGTEGRHSVQGLDVPDDLVADYQRHGVFALLGIVGYADGQRYGDLLARAHPSGTSMTWLTRTQ
ncbi:MAG TPA: DUF2332 domain-containing protein [Micromonosporaceae bacterium]